MGMSATERTTLLAKWIKPSSDSEQTQQARAEDMVRNAITTGGVFEGSNILIYTKGSYPNNTNVKLDSDVDVVVELHDCRYYEYKPEVTGSTPPPTPYAGSWTPDNWRKAVEAALVAAFGASSIDSHGKIAINVGAVPGSRPSADVVPSFDYRRYDDPYRQDAHTGSCVFPSDGGDMVVNWPQQQLENGRKLNTDTGGRYKNYVRALKNAENVLATAGTIDALPSYFMECLVFNVPTSTLVMGDLDDGFRATLVDLGNRLEAEAAGTKMVEPNRMKWLFTGDKKWKLQDGKDLISATWTHFGYEG